MSRPRTALVYTIVPVLAALTGLTTPPAIAAQGAANEPLVPVETVIGAFESDDEGWELGLGEEFPGAQGSFRRDDTDVDAGAYSGLLSMDFSEGGRYVQIGRDVDADAEKVTVRVRSSQVSLLRLRVVDATGQTHQQSLPIGADPVWKTLRFTTLTGGQDYHHFGGANDGRWHGPATHVALIVTKDDLVTSFTGGEVRFDMVTMVTPDPRLSIGQTRLGNVFTVGQRTEFTVATSGDRLIWTVHDHWGNRVASGKQPVWGGGPRLRLPVTKPGYYRLTVDAEADGQPLARAETVFAIVTEFDVTAVDESPFGINTHFGQRWPTDMMPLVAIAGAKNIRDEVRWNEVEIVQGEYGFRGKIDNFLGEMADHGLRPFALLDYTNPHYDNNSTPCTDAGRVGFANYADAVLDRYGDRISWVEVYNEFNIHFGDRGDCTADSKPQEYAALLRATYDRIKADHPETAVVGGATAGVPLTWLGNLFASSGLEKMDAVSVHPYNFPATPEAGAGRFDSLDRLVRQHNGGQPKPIWYSELGWPTHDAPNGTSEYNQAAYLVRSHVLALGKGVEKFFWHDFMNGGVNPTVVGANYGLVRNMDDPLGRWAPKPAYVSYAVMTRQLTGAQYAGADDVGEGIHSHVFTKDRTDTRVIWSAEPQTVAVETSKPLRVTDLTGRAETYWPQNGSVQLTVSGDPIYVKGDATGVAPSTRFTLTAENDATVALGERADLRLTVDNTSGAKAVKGWFEIAGEQVWIKVDAGEQAEFRTAVDSGDRLGHRVLAGRLIWGGELVARLTAGVEVISLAA